MGKILVFINFFIITSSFAQSKVNKVQETKIIEKSDNSIFQLYPTKNFWTFLKLDTRNGKISQVHFTVTADGGEGELELNPNSLIKTNDVEKGGRFKLYQTENIYNFLLIDQIEGSVYKVQWSMEENNRGIVPIVPIK